MNRNTQHTQSFPSLAEGALPLGSVHARCGLTIWQGYFLLPLDLRSEVEHHLCTIINIIITGLYSVPLLSFLLPFLLSFASPHSSSHPPLPSSRPPSVLQNIQCGFYACVILMYVIGPGSHISFSSKLLFKQAPCFQDPSMLFVFIHLPHCRNSMEGVHTFTQRPPSVWTLRGYQVPDTAKNTASHILVCVHLWVCKNFFGMYNQERDGGVIGCVYT